VGATYNTTELRRADGPQEHNAPVAWAAGASGSGVTVAVIDTGIDVDSPEFAGRLSSASVDLYTSRNSLNASDDHGTNVAMVAAAARDGTGILGMAWDATILAIRADEPGSCASDGNTAPKGDCAFLDSDIARGVDHAVANGARVINISLGGAGGATVELRDAVSNAAAAGVLVVIAAGNDGAPQLEDFARQLTAAGGGAVLVVGSVNENYRVSRFSNRPGDDSQNYISARGEGICCTYRDGALYLDSEGFAYYFSGTSFAAPQVAGAAALLAQAFPTLTGQQIAEILLRTAFDAGATGTDAVYGRGILDIARAMQPVGTTGIAGADGAIVLGEALGTSSPALGDALTTASISTIITDEYGRAYHADLMLDPAGARPRPLLHGALAGQQRHLSAGSGRASLAFTIDGAGQAVPLHLRPEEAGQARVLAASAMVRLSPATQMGLAFARGADGMVAQMQGQDRPAFMIAGSPAGDYGSFQVSQASMALRHQWHNLGLTISAEQGRTWSSEEERRAVEMRGGDGLDARGVTTLGLALDRRLGAVDGAIGLTWMAEDQRLLGMALQPGMGLAGADSLFLDVSAGWDIAPRWRVGGSVRHGRTAARSGGLLAPGSRLATSAFALDLARSGVVQAADTLALRLSQPLRVESGGMDLRLPVDWNYATLSGTQAIRHIALSPSGRELVGELAWRGALLGGQGSASLFWRRQPGHVASAPDDRGLALRWSAGF
jgi:hypothetical protein